MYESKKNIKNYLAFSVFLLFIVVFSTAYAADPSTPFITQLASGSGSSGSEISTDSNLLYMNKGNNSSVVGNYFSWEYYDSIMWYFKTDWSTNKLENVRIVWSTSACGDSYGYKLWGYAYSEYFWFVDFDYDDSTFVYYCLSDSTLHGYSYSSDLGFQNFEWIAFDIWADSDTVAEESSGNGWFVNEGSSITEEEGATTIGPDIIEFESIQESLFYIIK